MHIPRRSRHVLLAIVVTAVLAALVVVFVIVPGRSPRLVEFTSQTDGFRSLIPEGWQPSDMSPLIYTGDGDTPTLTQLFLPNTTVEARMTEMAASFAADSYPPPVETIQVNGLSWQRFQISVGGILYDLALAEHKGGLFNIQLTSLPDERDAAFNTIFLPVLQAFQPL
ncbi:MAG: hypothetical protein JNM70_24150 [Anaerolineae bacterium]|nr:hypothetical protein [Anaerolineae bacterium]